MTCLVNDNLKLHSDLKLNLDGIRTGAGGSDDLIIRELRIGPDHSVLIAVLYIDGLTEEKSIHQFILEPLMHHGTSEGEPEGWPLLDRLKNSVLTVGQLQEVDGQDAVLDALMNGYVIILADGLPRGIQISMAGWEQRAVTEPVNQAVIRGPKEAFTENIRVNTALIRRIIKTPKLLLKSQRIGRVTHTNVSIMYIEGIASEIALKEVTERLARIDTDSILESGYIEEFIQDETYTLFPTVQNTERPDTVAASLLEGRIAILIDGTPHVLIVPALFVQFFQSAEDYYQRADISTLLRMLRFLSLFIAVLVPALYIAVSTFHQEMLPTPLLISLGAQREGVPFPTFVEAMLMEATYEILREAGVRMPRAVGQAVSIVGTLVIGQAAVEAGIISAAMIIIVSITAISSYVIPEFGMSIAVRIIRFLFMGLAAAFGMFGIFLGIAALILHLSSLSSFGVPYMAPVGPVVRSDLKDVIVRVPRPSMTKRPGIFTKLNPIRSRQPSAGQGKKRGRP